MASLRLLAVLSVVALLHSTVLAVPKCEQWEWSRVGNGPIVETKGKQAVDCSSGWCHSYSFEEAASQKITYMTDCYSSDRATQTLPYECSPPEITSGETALRCYCKATSDSPCNSPMHMFDPEGNAGQKARALELRKMGIVAEGKTIAPGQREIDLQYFTCENWHMKFRPTGNKLLTGKTSQPCKGLCGMNVNREDAEKGVEVSSTCWGYTDKPTTCYLADSTKINMVCYCAGSDCNTAARLFDPKGDSDQKKRALDLRKMGVIAEWETITAGQPEMGFRFLTEFMCENWSMEFRPTVDKQLIAKTSEPCKGNCGINIARIDAEKGVDVVSKCYTSLSDLDCITRGNDPDKYTICYCIGSDCNSAASMFDPEGDAEQKSRALDLRKIGIIPEAKTTGTGREITYKFDDDFGKTTVQPPTAPTTAAPTTAPARTTAARAVSSTTVPEQATDDPAGDDGIEDAATGLSLAFAVVLTILRLI